MRASPRLLKGTRHIVKSRLAVVAVLAILALSLASMPHGSSAGSNSTSSSTGTSSSNTATSSNSTTSASATTTNNSSTTSTTTTTSTSTVKPVLAGIYLVDNQTLDSLVNSTSATFRNSTGTVPYYIVSEGGHVAGLVYLTTDVAPGESYGYHGPVGILAYIDPAGMIKALSLWSSNEPMTYAITPEYLASYTNHSVFDEMKVGADVLGITGATYSSVAIASGVRVGGRIVVNDFMEQTTTVTSTSTQTSSVVETTTSLSTTATVPTTTSLSTTSVTVSTGAAPALVEVVTSKQFMTASLVVFFFVAAVFAYEVNSDKLRYVILGAAVVILGFYYGVMISITDAAVFVSGMFPPLSQYVWYVLYAGALLTSLVWGRLYCGSICPFGSFTHLLHKISPFRAAMPGRVHRRLVYLKYVLLVLVVLAIAGGAFWATGVEPFVTFFFSRGSDWMWAVVGITVALSVPFDRFYCSYVCPAGAGLSIAARLRIREINRWSECNTCRVCERGCPTGAISGGRISALECMNCRKCEVNYSDPSVCPHYALQRVRGEGAGQSRMGGQTPGALVFSSENRAPP